MSERTFNFFVVFCFSCVCSSCIGDIDITETENLNCYPTIDGDYSVNMYVSSDTCSEEDEEEVEVDEVVDPDDDLRYRLHVIVQETDDDGGYIADLYVSFLTWYNVKIEPNGSFEAELDVFKNGMFLDKIYGRLTPGYVSATIELESNFEYLESCETILEFVGGPMYCRVAPVEVPY